MGKKQKISRIDLSIYKIQKAKSVQISKTTTPTASKKTINKWSSYIPHDYKDTILLIGEGNFSFSRSLCTLFLDKFSAEQTSPDEESDYSPESIGRNMVCTSLDSEQVLYEKYTDAKDHVKFLRDHGATILFEVDAKNLASNKQLQTARSELGSPSFDKIIFNFPHTGKGIKDMAKNVMSNRDLLKGFFASAFTQLRPPVSQSRLEDMEYMSQREKLKLQKSGEIYITLKQGEPYDSWRLVATAADATQHKLRLKTAYPFLFANYVGYAHRRTIGSRLKQSDLSSPTGTQDNKDNNENDDDDDEEEEEEMQDSQEFFRQGCKTYVFDIAPGKPHNKKDKKRGTVSRRGGR